MASNTDRRLDRLYGALTPKERAILVLRAWKEGREPGRHLLSSRTGEEAREYNRLIDLLQVASGELTQYAVVLDLMVRELGTRFAWFLTTTLWSNECEVGYERPDELREILAEQLRSGIALRSQELAALNVVLNEVADEFEREDPVKPEVREMIEETRHAVHELADDVGQHAGPVELAPPTDEQLRALRNLLVGRRSAV